MEQKTKLSLPILISLIIGGITALALVGVGSYFLVRTLINNQAPVAELIEQQVSPLENTQVEEPQEDSPVATSDLEELFSPFWLTRDLLHDNFIRQPVDDRILADGAIRGLEQYLETLEISLTDTPLPADAPQPEDIARSAGTPRDLVEIFTPFWQTWIKLGSFELPEEATQTLLMRHALAGMVASLEDDYTNYFDPDLANQYNIDLTGEYEGIGAWMDTRTEYLTVVTPMKGMPAEKAGLKPGDQVIAIDGEDMTGVDPNVAIKRVLGPAGTKVTLTIVREEVAEPFDIEIIRQRIQIPYIDSKMLESNIAYISLATFYDGGDSDFEKELEELLKNDPAGLIVDLRSNGGGYVHVTIGIVSDFLTEGIVLIEKFADGSTKEYPVLSRQGIAVDIPLVILVNEGSASASEIFAGAIRDYERGTIIGKTTFGKGSVQLPINLPDDQGMVSITHGQWLTPNGDTIQDLGIEPDIIVEFTEEDFNQGLDPQLDRAIEFLLTGE